MRGLFNKEPNGLANGPLELKRLTGSYYANNDYAKIEMDVRLETEKIIELIGQGVYNLAENFYHTTPPVPLPNGYVDLTDLVEHIRYPIAINATIKFYQGNIVSHEDTGRKTKIDKANETLPWEWMIDKDDQAHERKAFEGVDRLIKHLDYNEWPTVVAAWKDSPAQKATRDLFINSTKVFHDIYPIDKSGKFYHSVVPFIAEIQRRVIMPALGASNYASLLAWFKLNKTTLSGDTDINNDIMVGYIQQALPLLTMEMAVKRFSLKLLPYSIVQEFTSMMQTKSASQAALDDTIHKFLYPLKRDAAAVLDELKKHLNASDPEAQSYDMLPENNCNQKYFRT